MGYLLSEDVEVPMKWQKAPHHAQKGPGWQGWPSNGYQNVVTELSKKFDIRVKEWDTLFHDFPKTYMSPTFLHLLASKDNFLRHLRQHKTLHQFWRDHRNKLGHRLLPTTPKSWRKAIFCTTITLFCGNDLDSLRSPQPTSEIFKSLSDGLTVLKNLRCSFSVETVLATHPTIQSSSMSPRHASPYTL